MRYAFARESLDAAVTEPGLLVASSTDADWRSVLLRIYRSQAASEPFDTVATPDQTVVVHLRGHTELKVLERGQWHTGVTQPGSVGLTPANHRSRLRWRVLDAADGISAHLHIPQRFLDEAADHLSRPGANGVADHLNALSVDDRAVAAIVRDMIAGLEARESELFVETALVRLAQALLDPQRTRADLHRGAERIDDRRMRRAIEYMSYDLAAPINLSMIAREAAVSKFHFARGFRERLGMPPHAFLTVMRMRAADRMLRNSDLPVATIAGLVGYGTARNFSTAFARHFGMTPLSARRA